MWEYLVIEEKSAEHFNVALNAKTDDGWLLRGSLIITTLNSSNHYVQYTQMLERIKR